MFTPGALLESARPTWPSTASLSSTTTSPAGMPWRACTETPTVDPVHLEFETVTAAGAVPASRIARIPAPPEKLDRATVRDALVARIAASRTLETETCRRSLRPRIAG